MFKDHGGVDEVIIVGRSDRFGKKFGFVRFFEVVDADNLAVKLDNIFIGNEKLLSTFLASKEAKRGCKE